MLSPCTSFEERTRPQSLKREPAKELKEKRDEKLNAQDGIMPEASAS